MLAGQSNPCPCLENKNTNKFHVRQYKWRSSGFNESSSQEAQAGVGGLGYSGQPSEEGMLKARPNLLPGFYQRKAEERQKKEFQSEKRVAQRPRGKRILGQECSCVILSAESPGMLPWDHLSHNPIKVTHSSLSICTSMAPSLFKAHTHNFIPHSTFSSSLSRNNQKGSLINTIIEEPHYRIIQMITFLSNTLNVLTFKLCL